MDKVPNARIRQLCEMKKNKRMENDRKAKRVYEDEFAGSRLMGRPRKRWIHTVKNCFKKRGLEVRQAKRMMHDRSV